MLQLQSWLSFHRNTIWKLKLKKILATNRLKRHSAIIGSISATTCTLFYYNNACLVDAGKLLGCSYTFAVYVDFFLRLT